MLQDSRKLYCTITRACRPTEDKHHRKIRHLACTLVNSFHNKVRLEYIGMDRCLVGYLHHHQLKHLNKLEGALCQVTEVYSDNSDSPMKRHKHKKNFGCAIAAIVSSNEPKKGRKGRNKLQSPTKTPTNVDTPTNTNLASLNRKRSPGHGTENSRCTKNRKLSV